MQQHKALCKDLGLLSGDDLIKSHVAARLNGYVVGQGGIDQFDADASKLRLDETAVKYIRQLVIKYEGQGLHCWIQCIFCLNIINTLLKCYNSILL